MHICTEMLLDLRKRIQVEGIGELKLKQNLGYNFKLVFNKNYNDKFAIKHHQMHKIHNNYFKSKERNMILHQTKTNQY